MDSRTKNIVFASAGAFLVTTAVTLVIMTRKRNKPLEVVSFVDLEKYAGEWFEIARLPIASEANCKKPKAQYVVNKEGKLQLINSCHEGIEGKLKTFEATAYPIDSTNARLKVKFNWAFIKGDYQIIDLGNEYEYAMVGSGNRKYLWILSRTPELPLDIMKSLLNKASGQGFDISKLIFTNKS